eukprot:TRINITY_DN3473_c0_g1_i1.p1 TRINITY_DN3473_c0_g1~~TRINITY_DN3473_c0_g1_i1.p1  ORF type:complete len:562 (+),score=71.22 TRINITY_DN3473_c0_g1_i1:44-1729(+)
MGSTFGKEERKEHSPKANPPENIFQDTLSSPELPAEVWVSILRFQDTNALGKLSLVSQKWRAQTWPLATSVDSAWVTDQYAFDRILSRTVEECEKAKGVVALRSLALVPKRLKPSNTAVVLPLVDRLTSLKDLSIRHCDELRWMDLRLLENLVGTLESLRILSSAQLLNPPESIDFSAHLTRFKRLQSLELSCSSIKLDFFTALAGCTTLKQLVLRQGFIGNMAEQSSGISTPFTDCLMTLTQLTHLALLDVTIPNKFSAESFGNAVHRMTLLKCLNLVPAANDIGISKLGECPSVEELQLRSLFVSRETSNLEAQFPGLRKLCFYGCGHQNAAPLPFLNSAQVLTSLQSVYGLSRGVISNTANFVSLRRLQLVESPDIWEAEEIRRLSELTSLTDLDLGFYNFCDSEKQELFIDSAVKLTSLARLGLPVAHLDYLSRLTILQQLQVFRIRPVNVSEAESSEFSSQDIVFDHIRELVLDPTVTDVYLSKLLKAFPNVQRLQISADPSRAMDYPSIASLAHLQTLIASATRYYPNYAVYPSPHPNAKMTCMPRRDPFEYFDS